MNPEISFIISSENRQKIKDLLKKLQKEKQLEDKSQSIDLDTLDQSLGSYYESRKVMEILTNILYETLQFVNIIPNQSINDLNVEIEELKSVISAFENIKNNLIDFKNLVA
jgi:hypothetical protein